MKIISKGLIGILLLLLCSSCGRKDNSNEPPSLPVKRDLTAKDILGNPDYLAICYSGYRDTTRNIQPTVVQLKEDMKMLHAMGIKILRTYNTNSPQASNVLKAIRELKKEDTSFEMYVMLGAWINCEKAWTAKPNHEGENAQENAAEIQRAVKLAKQYPDIVKIIAVGNEAMVKWAASYFVQAGVILKWVNHLQALKKTGELPAEIWITSSDNFASWGGGGTEYHTKDLEQLIKAVDYISLHTYPMHDTHYNPEFWGVSEKEKQLSAQDQIDKAMVRAKAYAISQYRSVASYIESLGVSKPIHIGETGWASSSNRHYGAKGSKATDEYKEALYYWLMREWTQQEGIACFYFEAFDEIWKDAQNPGGSENHFGLFTINGQAKYALWDLVDQGVFKDLGRSGKPVTKTYNGKKDALLKEVLTPPAKILNPIQ